LAGEALAGRTPFPCPAGAAPRWILDCSSHWRLDCSPASRSWTAWPLLYGEIVGPTAMELDGRRGAEGRRCRCGVEGKGGQASAAAAAEGRRVRTERSGEPETTLSSVDPREPTTHSPWVTTHQKPFHSPPNRRHTKLLRSKAQTKSNS
jgi:hypothetical protein